MKMNVLIGSDAYGYALKETVKQRLLGRGIDVDDAGVHTEENTRAYYDTAFQVASRISRGEIERGILVCATGMGMSIIANKLPGVYAAVCENRAAAERARSINNSNVLTLGSLVTATDTLDEILDAWLYTEFTSGWDPAIQNFLRHSMTNIHRLESQAFGLRY
jgi:ribose 5-phosphate isomerase B